MVSGDKEASHYVATAYPSGGVQLTTKCNFLSPFSVDVVVAKTNRLEVRQFRDTSDGVSPFPVVVSVPVNGRIVALAPIKVASSETSYVFVLTSRHQYAILGHDSKNISTDTSGKLHNPYPIVTLASGSLQPQGLITIIPINKDYVRPRAHKGDHALPTPVLPTSTLLQTPVHCRIEERGVLALTFLHSVPEALPQFAVLHQDSRGAQHITSHVVSNQNSLFLNGSLSAPPTTEWLQKSNVDGGSSILLPLPFPAKPPVAAAAAATTDDVEFYEPPAKHSSGGLLVLGQRQLLHFNASHSKLVAIPQALILSAEELPADPNVSGGLPRYLLGDEFGNLHMMTCEVAPQTTKIIGLQIDTLGSCTIGNSLSYLNQGLCFVGSTMGDSQLVQIHDEPIPPSGDEPNNPLAASTYLSVVEEYTHLGPIVDMDLVPSDVSRSAAGAGGSSGQVQSQVVTASGSSLSGSLRIVRNGIGMHESAAVEIPGIQNIWNLRSHFDDKDDMYLVQSFVHETRVLGVVPVTDDEDEAMGDAEEGGGGATLAEVFLAGLDSTCATLFVRNIKQGDAIVQVTERQIRLATGDMLLDSWDSPQPITVAAVNDSGQVVVSQSGGHLVYLNVQDGKLTEQFQVDLDHEVSCIDLNPFIDSDGTEMNTDDSMRRASPSSVVAVGLWDDYTVRILSLESELSELLNIRLNTEEETEDESNAPSRRNRNNMMARSLCLITLDLANGTQGPSSSSPATGVDMLFVGLGDGTLVSFVIVQQHGVFSAKSRKEVCLGTQRVDLVPLVADQGGSCVLATGDRPTVVYFAGTGATSTNNLNPKLSYSNVNLSAGDEDEDDDVSRPPSQQSIAINVAAPFSSSVLYEAAVTGGQRYSLCVADDSFLRMGVIDDIQKLHVTKCRLGMAPRRLVHCLGGRLFAVGCIKSGIRNYTLGADEPNMGNCIRFLDDTTFEDVQRVDLEPFEMILSMEYAVLRVPSPGEIAVGSGAGQPSKSVYKSFLLVGTAYVLADEDEPTRGRILVYSCQADENDAASTGRAVRLVTELSTQGGVYSMSQFYDGRFLCTVGSKTHVAQLGEEAGVLRLQYLGVGHHGHIVSLCVKSLAEPIMNQTEDDEMADIPAASQDKKKSMDEREKLAIVGDLMRSISLVQYYPQHETLEEVARDFTPNWTTAVQMLTEDIYLGSENFSGLFCLRRNKAASSPEVRCRLENIGEFHLGELVNKFMSGSLVVPVSANTGNSSSFRNNSSPKKQTGDVSPSKKAGLARAQIPALATGSQTLFGTAEGSIGVVVGLDDMSTAFLLTLERSMVKCIQPIGNFSHEMYRCCQAESRRYPSRGFVDGDLIESFLDLDRSTMDAVVSEMNRDRGWEALDEVEGRKEDAPEDMDGLVDGPTLTVDDILVLVEDISMLH